ncbi:MAG: hypothetical protein K2M34_04460 [Alphaproteobacteria bacterium]|nr:hypothetical protein [Alphaproteobacteria bacterium]
MKTFILLATLFLTSCVTSEPFPYKCGKITDNNLQNYNIYKDDYLCVANNIANNITSYSRAEFTDFIDYSVTTNKLYDTNNQGRFSGSYFADKDDKRISDTKTIHVINAYVFDDYQTNKRKQEAEQKEKEEQKNKKQIAKQHPEIRNKLKKQFFSQCEYNMQNSRIQLNQNYIQQMCECLACVFNGIAVDNTVYEYVKNNNKAQFSIHYKLIMSSYYDHCDRYVTGIADYNPCKWANGEYPFK